MSIHDRKYQEEENVNRNDTTNGTNYITTTIQRFFDHTPARMSLVPVVRKIAYLPHNYIQLLFWPGGSMAQHIVTNPYPSSFA